MRWLPAHKAHAIERVNLSFQFSEALPAKPWQALLNLASLELPKQGFNTVLDEVDFALPGGGVQINFGPGGLIAPVAATASTPNGRQFQIVAGSQVREEVHLNRSRFTHSSAIYDGWQSHRARVLSLLSPYFDRALPLTNVQIIKVEYWDRFVFDGPSSEVAYDELLKVKSPYVPVFAFATKQLWHAHTGYFVSSHPSRRRLVNVNFDVIDVVESVADEKPPGAIGPKRSVGIYTTAQDTLVEEASPATSEDLGSTLDDLHTILKSTFTEVITREAADRISLTARASS